MFWLKPFEEVSFWFYWQTLQIQDEQQEIMYSPCQGQNQSFKSCEILLLDPEPEAQDA